MKTVKIEIVVSMSESCVDDFIEAIQDRRNDLEDLFAYGISSKADTRYTDSVVITKSL